MNKLTVALLVSSALTLSACGGSGSNIELNMGENHNSDSDSTKIPERNIQGLMENGEGFVATSGKNLHSITVDGHTIELDVPGFFIREIINLNKSKINGKLYKKFIVSGLDYKDSTFGYIVGDVTGDQGVIFSQGERTRDMPSEGSATYQGSSVYVADGDVTIGKATLNVDFASKNLNGILTGKEPSGAEKYNLNFNAGITGNTFRDDGNSAAKVEGQFYGGNAAEVGGIFEAKDAGFKGSFGATKQ